MPINQMVLCSHGLSHYFKFICLESSSIMRTVTYITSRGATPREVGQIKRCSGIWTLACDEFLKLVLTTNKLIHIFCQEVNDNSNNMHGGKIKRER